MSGYDVLKIVLGLPGWFRQGMGGTPDGDGLNEPYAFNYRITGYRPLLLFSI